MEKYVCRCGYVYDPADGDKQGGVAPGTAFDDLPASWVCPMCGLAKANFTKLAAGTITVAVKCFTTLVKAGACDYKGSTRYALPERSTVRDLIDKLQLPVEGIKLIFVNNIEVQPDTILNDGDQVGFSPAVGAM